MHSYNVVLTSLISMGFFFQIDSISKLLLLFELHIVNNLATMKRTYGMLFIIIAEIIQYTHRIVSHFTLKFENI